MAIESPQKQLKRTFFILQHPRRHPRHFGSLLAALKADHEEPSYRTSADPEHAYLSTRKAALLTAAVVRHRFRANYEPKRGNRPERAQTAAFQTFRVLRRVLEPEYNPPGSIMPSEISKNSVGLPLFCHS